VLPIVLIPYAVSVDEFHTHSFNIELGYFNCMTFNRIKRDLVDRAWRINLV